MTQLTILFEVTRSGWSCSSINKPKTEWIHIRINARNGLLRLSPRKWLLYWRWKNMYFLFVKSTLALYAPVVIQEHNIVSVLSHTCEKHSQCISLYKCTLLMTDPLDVRVGWNHIWRFHWTWKTDERCLSEQKSTWENSPFCWAARSKTSIKSSKYVSVAWLDGTKFTFISFSGASQLREKCAHEQATVLWGGPGVQQCSMVSRCMYIFVCL